VRSTCYTRAISERFRDKELIIKRYINSPSLLYFKYAYAIYVFVFYWLKLLRIQGKQIYWREIIGLI